MKNSKRILAVIGIILLLSLSVFAFISAFTATEDNNTFFMLSIFCCVMVPILLYLLLLIIKRFKSRKSNDEVDIREVIRDKSNKTK